MYQNENKTCLKYPFHSSWSLPWATKLPNVAVCTLCFPTGPFLKGTMVFLSRRLGGKDGWSKRGWWGQELPQRLRVSGRMVRVSGLLQTLMFWRHVKAAREIRIHSSCNWLFSCSAERHSLAQADSYCFLLLPLGVGAKEMWGKDAALGG